MAVTTFWNLEDPRALSMARSASGISGATLMAKRVACAWSSNSVSCDFSMTPRRRLMLSSFTTNVILQREGLEALLHAFAFNYSLLYGLFAVALAVGAGLAASAIFSRSAH